MRPRRRVLLILLILLLAAAVASWIRSLWYMDNIRRDSRTLTPLGPSATSTMTWDYTERTLVLSHIRGQLVFVWFSNSAVVDTNSGLGPDSSLSTNSMPLTGTMGSWPWFKYRSWNQWSVLGLGVATGLAGPTGGVYAFAAPHWLIVATLAAATILLLRYDRASRRARGQCPSCGYDLKGDLAAGCPECGWNRAPAETPA